MKDFAVPSLARRSLVMHACHGEIYHVFWVRRAGAPCDIGITSASLLQRQLLVALLGCCVLLVCLAGRAAASMHERMDLNEGKALEKQKSL